MVALSTLFLFLLLGCSVKYKFRKGSRDQLVIALGLDFQKGACHGSFATYGNTEWPVEARLRAYRERFGSLPGEPVECLSCGHRISSES
ncbi:MAG: hypothetical protein EHM23_36015 [Acidobacteria bacterium]|nr:MAG: hypothetical protein EHM23_36015 [Acidobacteriota bacterium]